MRFHGPVGYADDEQTSPGVWTEVIIEIDYYGDVIRNFRRQETPSSVIQSLNENVTSDNSISIVADPYAHENFEKMRYVRWNGSNWKITSIEVRRPRIILQIGGLWNGKTA